MHKRERKPVALLAYAVVRADHPESPAIYLDRIAADLAADRVNVYDHADVVEVLITELVPKRGKRRSKKK